MSFQILEEPGGRNLRINVRGKLAKGDYRQFVQNFEPLANHRSIETGDTSEVASGTVKTRN